MRPVELDVIYGGVEKQLVVRDLKEKHMGQTACSRKSLCPKISCRRPSSGRASEWGVCALDVLSWVDKVVGRMLG